MRTYRGNKLDAITVVVGGHSGRFLPAQGSPGACGAEGGATQQTRDQGGKSRDMPTTSKDDCPVLSHKRDCLVAQSSVPAHGSPEQATAVFEFVDALRKEIWSRYGLQIQRVLRNDRVTTYPFEQTDINESDEPF